MAIQLTEKTTASDVIAKFHWRRQNSIKDEIDKSKNKREKKENANVDFCLCETGGNIGIKIHFTRILYLTIRLETHGHIKLF